MKRSEEPHFNNVLLIDDEEIDNLINERLIQAHYFARNVQVRTNIPAALAYIYKTIEAQENIPDVIFLDLHLPEYDGFHFLLEFKQMRYKYEELKRIRVVILSAFLDQFSEKIFSNYPFVADRVLKPLREDTLLNVAEKIHMQLARPETDMVLNVN